MPVLFCALTYALLWLALQPVWALGSAAAGALVADQATNFDSNLTSIYDAEAYATVDAQEGFISGRDVEFPDSGAQYGQLICERIGLDAPVYWYDSNEILAHGVGQSLTSLPPGFGGPIFLSGHNTTFFRCLEYVAEGDVIQFRTNYCNYEYTVNRVEVLNEVDLSNILTEKCVQEEEELVMYTCYPFYTVTGRKTDRLTVFATRTSGLDVKWKDLD